MLMTCRDFEQGWNELLDGRANAENACELEQALEAHAAGCAGCRERRVQYQTLRQALLTLGRSPLPSAGFVDRVLAASQAAQTLPSHSARRRPRPLFRLAAAAAVLLAGLATIRLAWISAPQPVQPLAQTTPEPERPLTVALAEATSATWDLARAASAPAARIGTEVFDSAEETLAEEGPALPEAEPVVPAADVWQEVGDRITSSVGPLSGSARHAFGFLIDPAVGGADTQPPAHPRDGS